MHQLSPEERLEQTQWDFFWVSRDAIAVDRPEIAYLSCDRDVLYLNTVVRTRAPDDDPSRLIAEVGAAHRTVRSRWAVYTTTPTAALERGLGKAGYSPTEAHHACVIETAAYRPRLSEGIEVRLVESIDDLRASIDVSGRAFGNPHTVEQAELEDQLQTCTGEGKRVRRFVAYDRATGEALCAGGLNLYPKLRFGFLWGGGTVPEARGRGAYSALLRARMDLAESSGIDMVGLYARVNTSAPIVAKQGFVTVGGMTCWQRPPVE